MISTHPQKPFKSLADVITAAKAKPDAVSYASVGSGSIGHLAMVLLSKQAGVRLVQRTRRCSARSPTPGRTGVH